MPSPLAGVLSEYSAIDTSLTSSSCRSHGEEFSLNGKSSPSLPTTCCIFGVSLTFVGDWKGALASTCLLGMKAGRKLGGCTAFAFLPDVPPRSGGGLVVGLTMGTTRLVWGIFCVDCGGSCDYITTNLTMKLLGLSVSPDVSFSFHLPHCRQYHLALRNL